MPDNYHEDLPPSPTRRKFLLTSGTSVAASLVAAYVPASAKGAAGAIDSAATTAGPAIEGAVPIALRINGKDDERQHLPLRRLRKHRRRHSTGSKTRVPLDKIEVELGDSALPDGPISGGSLGISSVIPAVFKAVDQAITSLLLVAVTTPNSRFLGHKPDDLALEAGRVFVKAEGLERGVPFGDLLRRANARLVTGSGSAEMTAFAPNPKFSKHSFGCHFVEVTWQPEIARLRVSRVVTVMDAGRILNPLTGRNQIQGAVVMGIGMALFEETIYDPQNGAPLNSNLAGYMVTVNADAPPIDVTFLDYPDKEINELGARGIGEIGLAGVAAAITAAVHHATGVRVRELPVKIEDLLVVS